ncbi:cytochrome c biogenesis heme-transporting ATPase CcmA [Aquabacterium sp.]|uniref:cytochrome c biogenesis heme-transporting ATPase CcmA n=1 Tax=Aquabacterium sp. TaxID=1872578 RepID=UPI0025BF785D|nr:cytochrome c biogenesis heme-transporting ATPase CcmA [Aquabacterium sp.]
MHLHAQDLACRRGGRLLFAHLHMAVMPGQLLWVRGPNGQGKTSLLRLLAGLSQAADGQIDRPVPLAYIGHQHGLKDDLNAIEALSFLLRLHDLPFDDQTCTEALTHMGVHRQRLSPVRTLSQGQKRRVALARLCLSASSKLWILDEPFDALDDQGITTLNKLIQQHCQNGGAVILTSHQALSLPGAIELDLSLVRKG